MPTDNRRTFLKTVGLAAGAATLSGSGMVLAQQDDEDDDSTDGSSSWTAFRGDAGRTGATDASGPAPYATADWSMDVGGAMRVGDRNHVVEPLFAEGTLYLAVATDTGTYASDGFIAAYDPETGDELWKQTDVPAPFTPTVDDGTLYFATNPPGSSAVEKGGLYALDASDGTEKWSREDYRGWATPVVADGYVYTAYGRSWAEPGIVGLDAETGETVWENTDVDTDEVCYADGTLFARTGTALNADDGSVTWEDAPISLEVVHDGLVYGSRVRDGEPGYDITAFSASDGNKEWEQSIDINPEKYEISNLAVGDGTVFALTYVDTPDQFSTDEVQKLHAFDAETGAPEWTYETMATTYGDPTVADGTVYLGGRFSPDSESDPAPPAHYKAFVYAIDAESGESEWNYVLDSQKCASTPVAWNGRVYVPTFWADSDYAKYVDSRLFVLESTDDAPDADHRITNDDPDAWVEPPEACIEASPDLNSCTLEPGDQVTLNGTCSTDSTDTDLVYDWDIDGDGEYETRGDTVTVTVPRCGSLTVTLKVTDGTGTSDTTSVVISSN